MSALTPPPLSHPGAPATAVVPTRSAAVSPNQRAWARFRRNRLGYLVAVDLRRDAGRQRARRSAQQRRAAGRRYDGKLYFPMLQQPAGDGASAATSARRPTGHDPFIAEQFAEPGNWVVLHAEPPLGDVDRLLREGAEPGAARARATGSAPTTRPRRASRGCSTAFASASCSRFALTVVGMVIGIAAGAVQGYFGGPHRPRHAAPDRDLERRCPSSTC